MLNAPQYGRVQKQRRNVSKFAALIANPATDEVVLPANGRLSVVSVAGCAAGTVAVTTVGVSDRSISTPELDAGGRHPIGYFERAVTVTIESGFELYLDQGLGRWVKIAESS
jgi:hypothetical protein